MGEIEDGRYLPEDPEDVVDQMIDRAEDHFGQSLGFDGRSAVRSFYRPIAAGFVEREQDLREVLNSAQIEYAEGESLDLLCALINVTRRRPTPSRGEVVFSREDPAPTDLLIPEGEIVQTPSEDPRKYETTQTVSIEEGETEATAPVRSVGEGPEYNVSTDSVTVFESRPSGIEGVTNPEPISGAEERETDEELRSRAKRRLADGANRSRGGIVTAVENSAAGIRKVDLFVNNTSTEEDGLPPHSFELVVEAEDELTDEIAQAIIDNKAEGVKSVGGVNAAKEEGEALLPNEQTVTVDYSKPEIVNIYIHAGVEVNENAFQGEDEVKDEIVDYIGGNYVSGESTEGDLRMGEDVVTGEVKYQIRNVDGVYDITNIDIGTTSSPSGDGNVEIESHQMSVVEADAQGTIELNISYI